MTFADHRNFMCRQYYPISHLRGLAVRLSRASDPAGGVQGATVQTFIDAGINRSTTCIENSLWTDPDGFEPGTYLQGADGFGTTTNSGNNAWDRSGSLATHGNTRDFRWLQVGGNRTSWGARLGGRPSRGIVFDLG